jgi:hypothetical protein
MAGRHAECLAAWQQLEQTLHNPATAPSPDLILFTVANAPLCDSHTALRQWPQAIAGGHDSLAAARQLGIPRLIALALARLGHALREAGQIPEAVPLLREAAEIFTTIGMSEEAQEIIGELQAITGAASSCWQPSAPGGAMIGSAAGKEGIFGEARRAGLLRL